METNVYNTLKLTCCRIPQIRPSWILLRLCLRPQRMIQSPLHTQPINDKEHFRLYKEHSDDRIFIVLTPTLPVAVLMSLAQPSTEPVSTREPSLLHARQVSAPWCPSWPVDGDKPLMWLWCVFCHSYFSTSKCTTETLYFWIFALFLHLDNKNLLKA